MNPPLAWAIASFLSLAAGAGAASRPSVLSTDPKLAETITLRLRLAPLCDLAAEVSRKTGVPLATSIDTADERVTLFARERPAREVLARVAEHFDYSWVAETRKGKRTLVLVQDLAAKRREQALRGGAARDVDFLRDYLEQAVARVNTPEALALRKRPRVERLRLVAELEDRLYGPKVVEPQGDSAFRVTRRHSPGTAPSPEETVRLRREWETLRSVSPEAAGFETHAIARSCYEAMPAAAREALWRGDTVVLAHPPERGRLPLSLAQAEELVAGGLGHLADRGHEDYVPFHSVERVRVHLALQRRGTETSLDVRLRTVGSYGEGEERDRVEWVHHEELRPRYMRPPKESAQPLDEASRRLADPVTLPPPRKDPTSISLPRGVEAPTITELEDVLEALADRVPHPILADGYIQGALSGALVNGPAPLHQVLERACKVFDRICRFERGYLMLRHHEWAEKRAQEPPARLVRRWQRSIDRYGALRLEDTTRIAALTPEQAEVLKERLKEPVRGSVTHTLESDLKQSGAALRLLGQIPASARSALEKGQPVPFSGLPRGLLPFAAPLILESTEGVSGYDHDEDEGEKFVPGTGFALEDALEQRFLQSRIRLRRSPIRWVWQIYGWVPIESDEQLKQLREAWRKGVPALQPDGTLIGGERVEVIFEMPGAEPVSHFFLHPTRELRPASMTRP